MFVLSATVLGAVVQTSRAAVAGDLRANLVVSDDRILIYGGMDRGLQVGQQFAVVRNNERIATIQITEVRTSSSIARVITKMNNLKDNDLLIPLGASIQSGGFSKAGMRLQEAPAPPAPAPDAKTKIEDAPPAPAPAPAASSSASSEKKASSGSEEKKTSSRSSSSGDSSSSSRSSSSSSRSSSRSGDSSSSRSSSRSSSDSSSKSSDDSGDSKSASSSSRSSGRSSSSSSGRSSSGSSDASSAKTEAKAAPAAAPVKKKEKPADPRGYEFSTTDGFSGLWTIPTSDIIPKSEAAFSYFHGWYEASTSYRRVTSFRYNSITSYTDMETSEYSLTYGLGRDVEIAIGRYEIDTDSVYFVNNNVTKVSSTSNSGMDGWSLGIKWNPRKHFLLEPTTSKKEWQVAFGAQRIEFEDSNGHNIYMIISLPLEKFDLHAGLFHYNMEGVQEKRLGSMAGVEIPLSSSLVLLGEAELFQAQYTYNLALRYVHRQKYSLLMGMADATDSRVRQLGLSMTY